MQSIRRSGEDVRSYILRNVARTDLSSVVAKRFQITRQAVNRHLKNLVAEGALTVTGNNRSKIYKLAATSSTSFHYKILEELEEDVAWRNDVRPFLASLPENVLEIWHLAFTEMFNNAIDHSAGKSIGVHVSKSAINAEMYIADDGVGIFAKIQHELKLADERQAIFELSKGKLTTDKKNHSGQGIFFTSRMVSRFGILSGDVYFSHEQGSEDDWLLEPKFSKQGTTIFLKVENHTSRSTRKVLNEFSTKGSYGFNKTIVPVKLAKYGTDQLVSRSQAKRVLARVELFSQVLFDFTDVDTIGQAFADQIFRVFAQEHPEVKLVPTRANRDVLGMINAAIRAGRLGFKGDASEKKEKL